MYVIGRPMRNLPASGSLSAGGPNASGPGSAARVGAANPATRGRARARVIGEPLREPRRRNCGAIVRERGKRNKEDARKLPRFKVVGTRRVPSLYTAQ